jgi:hypothetical protein
MEGKKFEFEKRLVRALNGCPSSRSCEPTILQVGVVPQTFEHTCFTTSLISKSDSFQLTPIRGLIGGCDLNTFLQIISPIPKHHDLAHFARYAFAIGAVIHRHARSAADVGRHAVVNMTAEKN